MGLEEQLQEYHEFLYSEEFLKYIRLILPRVLDREPHCALKAKELAENPELYAYEPGGRLGFIKSKVEKSKFIDYHFIAAYLQAAYNVDMNMRPDSAYTLISSSVQTQISIDSGLLEVTENGDLRVAAGSLDGMKEEIEKDETAKKIAEDFKERLNKGEEAFDDEFEGNYFSPSGSSFTLDQEKREWVAKRYGVIRKVVVEKFGEPKIPEITVNPYPKIEAFVRDLCSLELKLEIPDYKLKVSGIKNPGPNALQYVHVHTDIGGQEYICIPSSDLSGTDIAKLNFALGVAHELTHIMRRLGQVGSRADLEKQDFRIAQFKRDCWEEGLAVRMQERATSEYLLTFGDHSLPITENQREKIAQSFAQKQIDSLSDWPLQPHLMEQFGDYSAHLHFGYWFGWYIMRQLPRSEIQKQAHQEKPYFNPEFPWNGGKIKNPEKIEYAYSDMKKLTQDYYKGKPEEQRINDLFSLFEQDWKQMNKQIVLK